MTSIGKRLRTNLGRAWLAALLAAAGPAAAGFTDPVLVLEEVRAGAGTTRTFLQLAGRFHEPDLVQIPLPIQILVRDTQSGTSFVRYDVTSGAFAGNHPALADGLDPSEAAVLATLGSAAPDARVLTIRDGRIELLLPSAFPSGPAEVQLFLVDEGLGILSNPFPVVLPEPGAP